MSYCNFIGIHFTKVSILPDSDSNRTSTVDGLRGILALSVMAHHFISLIYGKLQGTGKSLKAL